jgi:uncharacterized membrane protein YccC
MTRDLLFRIFGKGAIPGTFDPRWALFSANSFIAAMLAIYLAFQLGLQRPYWAMLTVYLTAQPLVGAVRSRAIYRLLGTLLGACAALAFVPILVDRPTLLSVAITGWAGTCLYIALQDRTPRSYVFMLAGYTATTVVFSSVATPELVFDTALARVEEIALGICCATVVHTLLFPRSVAGAAIKTLDSAIRDATAWTADTFLRQISTGSGARWRLAADVTDLEVLLTHLPYDTSAPATETQAIREIQDHVALVLPILKGIEERLDALGERRTPELDDLLKQLGAWACDPNDPYRSTEELLQRCEKFAATLNTTQVEWDRLLEITTIAKAATLIDALATAHRLSAIIHGSGAPGQTEAARPKVRRARRVLHRDQGLAALSVVAFFVAVLGCCAVWIATAWPEGSVAAQIAAIAAALYSSLDDPAPTLISFAIWTVASLPIAAIYLFLIFPAIDGFPMLAASLAPPFLVFGYLQATPRHMLKALGLGLGLIGALDLQNRFSADFASFANVNGAAVIGLLAAFLAVRTLRSVTSKRAAQRLLRHGWSDLAVLAAARRPMNRARWLGVMLDRLGLVVPRLTLAGANVEAEAGRSLAALQIGLDLLDLKTSLLNSRNELGEDIEGLSARLTHAFRWFAAGSGELRPSDAKALLDALDIELRGHSKCDPIIRRSWLTALVGVRCALFPNSPAPMFDGVVR